MPTQEEHEPMIPLQFGSVADDTVVYHGADSLPVGRIVAECLDEQGIRYEWDQTPGSPILVHADPSLSGIPTGGSHRAIYESEEHLALRAPCYPDTCFDKVEENPVRLLNVTRAGRVYPNEPRLHGRVPPPKAGDHVKLGFLVRDAVAPEAREEVGKMIDLIQLESMWVEVTAVLGKYPQCVYRGELVNVPMFIDPAQLRIGSPVHFTSDQIYPVQKRSTSRVGR
jgi:hypothetical protein